MEVTVSGANSVTIDGDMVGNVSDAFANHRDASGAIYDALVAYEQTLRQATIDVQELLDAANARITELETQATADQTFEAGLEAAQASFNSQLATAVAGYSDSLEAARSEFATGLQTAQQKQALAESCERAHCTLNTVLIAKGDSDAAVAAVQEINKANHAREKAELLARVAALPTG